MYRIILGLLIITMPFTTHAQLGGVLKKVKDKATQRLDNKVDKEIEQALDQIEGKQTSTGTTTNNTGVSNSTSEPAKQGVKSYSKFDFIPGEKILYSEDFSQDATGELPLTWNASGKGEVQTVEGKNGKWLRIFENTTYLTGNKKELGENYTIEFDLIYYFQPKVKGYVLPHWKVGVLSSGDIDAGDNALLKQQDLVNNTYVHIANGSNGGAIVESRAKRVQTFRSDRMELGDLTTTFNRVVHYSIQVQKSRFRMWMDERKIFDIPRAVNTAEVMNQLYFFLEGSNYQEDEVGLFVSNIKIATGLPHTRHKLIDEGQFSTTGILFDVNAATIKPESAGVLKEIGTVLKENENVKVKIIGHTDSDGADAANLELSRRRAEAVKAALSKDYGIDETRMTIDGMGETKPVADNKTKEGKAQNRRVEFVKL